MAQSSTTIHMTLMDRLQKSVRRPPGYPLAVAREIPAPKVSFATIWHLMAPVRSQADGDLKTFSDGANRTDFRVFSPLGCLIFGKIDLQLKYLTKSPMNKASFPWDQSWSSEELKLRRIRRPVQDAGFVSVSARRAVRI
jgi:hypothetical protein